MILVIIPKTQNGGMSYFIILSIPLSAKEENSNFPIETDH